MQRTITLHDSPTASEQFALHQRRKHAPVSPSVLSGSRDAAGSVSHTVVWAFTQTVSSMNFQSCDLFSPSAPGYAWL